MVDDEFEARQAIAVIGSYTDARNSATQCQYSEVKFVVTIVRRAKFYVYCVYMPVMFLTALGLYTVWLLPPPQVNDRVQIALTLLLAAVGFRSGAPPDESPLSLSASLLVSLRPPLPQASPTTCPRRRTSRTSTRARAPLKSPAPEPAS